MGVYGPVGLVRDLQQGERTEPPLKDEKEGVSPHLPDIRREDVGRSPFKCGSFEVGGRRNTYVHPPLTPYRAWAKHQRLVCPVGERNLTHV